MKTRRFHRKAAGFLLAERRPSHRNRIRPSRNRIKTGSDDPSRSRVNLYGYAGLSRHSTGLITMNGNKEDSNFRLPVWLDDGTNRWRMRIGHHFGKSGRRVEKLFYWPTP